MARRPHRLVIAAVVVAVCLAFILLEIAQIYIARAVGQRGRDDFGAMFVGFLQPYAAFLLATPPVVLLARRFPIAARRLWSVPLHAVAALAFAVLHLGLDVAINALRAPQHTDFVRLTVQLLGHYLVPDVIIYAAIAAIVMVLDARRALRDREVVAAELSASLAEARLAALRGQLQPHFLFNAMNSVGMLIREERPRDALVVLAELGALLRALLADGAAHEVALAAELDFSRRYLGLEQVRFGDRLAVSFTSEPGLERGLVPNLVLQPLVENAVRHGVARHAGPGRVAVRAFREGARLVLEVQNDGPPPSPELAGGTGLSATRGRLASLYGDDHELSLAPAPGGGAIARVAVPFHTRPLEVAAA
jgi:signal transduction histidine kinase